MIRVAEHVRAALIDGRAVVALESTVIAHGLPRPINLETARAMEAAVRAAGAVPATIGIVAGQPIVGLSSDELELMATVPDVAKASRGDLAVLVARGAHGATTVAGTLALMELAGISVLATGGIGGVHRGAERTFDISADLAELARTRALVVCSGAKSILDLPRTLELLETLGVTVLGYQTDELPAFFNGRSGLPVTARVDDADSAAAVVRARRELGLSGAVILAVQPPAEVVLTSSEATRELDVALAGVERDRIRGRDVTPYLLSRVAELSGGRSLAANRALLVNNARTAAEVATVLNPGSGRPGSRGDR